MVTFTPLDQRPEWKFVPFETVGPLRFGMTLKEAGLELGVPEQELWQPSHWREGKINEAYVGGVDLYFGGTFQLQAIAIDALHGPRLVFGDFNFTGRSSVDIMAWFDIWYDKHIEDGKIPDEMGRLRYFSLSPEGFPSSEPIGLTVRAQWLSGQKYSRPVVVSSGWAENVGDTESTMAEREWHVR